MPTQSPLKSTLRVVVLCLVLAIAPSAAWASASDDCVRSEPAPIFDAARSDIKSHRFVPVSGHEAKEYAVLASGASLEIHHGGCESFVTTFRWQSAQLARNVKSRLDAYMAAATLLRELKKVKESSGFDLALAATVLETAARKNPNIEFEEQLAVKGDGIDFLQAQVQVDAAGQKSGIGFIQVSLFRGPL
jgi:hypothetical protein